MYKQFIIAAALLIWFFYCLSEIIVSDVVDEVAGVYQVSGVIGQYHCNQKRNISYVTLADLEESQRISFRISRNPSSNCEELKSEFPVGAEFSSFYLKKALMSLEVEGREVVSFEAAKEENNDAFLFLAIIPVIAALIGKWRTNRKISQNGKSDA